MWERVFSSLGRPFSSPIHFPPEKNEVYLESRKATILSWFKQNSNITRVNIFFQGNMNIKGIESNFEIPFGWIHFVSGYRVAGIKKSNANTCMPEMPVKKLSTHEVISYDSEESASPFFIADGTGMRYTSPFLSMPATHAPRGGTSDTQRLWLSAPQLLPTTLELYKSPDPTPQRAREP